MSFVDLATLTLHRRNEMEDRINVFVKKCDHAISDIVKLKLQAQSFVHQLNCEPSELKDRFLTCMKQLDEYIYLMTDFNLAVGKYGETGSLEYTPVHDTTSEAVLPINKTYVNNFNIIDMLSEPMPSTSMACRNFCPVEKAKKKRIPKEEQQLIQFSSSSSSESVPLVKATKVEKTEKEIQCELVDGGRKIGITESINLPAQTVLQVDHEYPAVIMNIDGASFWVIIEDPDQVFNLMVEMTEYYKEHHVEVTLEEVTSQTYCAFYDRESDTYYRGLFLRLIEEDINMAEVFLVDTGEVRLANALECLQPLLPKLCAVPPYARCCHLAGVDLINYHDEDMAEKQEDFMRQYVGQHCSIEIDDNISESLGVYVILPDGEILNNLVVNEGLAYSTTPEKRTSVKSAPSARSTTSTPKCGPPEMARGDSAEISDCPEYEDPVEAVTGYSCRDEADICKHYKGGPEKTCFKGTRCKKKHVMIHPDGWTLDKVQVSAKCPPPLLPAPNTWHKVEVTCVQHYDAVYVQFQHDKPKVKELPQFGQVLPPDTLEKLIWDMNSPATKLAYKPLKIVPAPGELVAALFPLDELWYRARVISSTRADQSVEVMYIDYGNTVWLKENEVRHLEDRHLELPCQATRCVIAGVKSRGQSDTWQNAKQRLSDMLLGRTAQLHVVARDYDELTVEIFDEQGYSIAEQLAALNLVSLHSYSVIDDTQVKQKLVVP